LANTKAHKTKIGTFNMTYTKPDLDLIQFLSDPDNVDKFIATAITESLGFDLTEDGRWVRLDS